MCSPAWPGANLQFSGRMRAEHIEYANPFSRCLSPISPFHIHTVAPLETHMQPSHQIEEQFSWAFLGIDLVTGYLSYSKWFLCFIWLKTQEQVEEELILMSVHVEENETYMFIRSHLLVSASVSVFLNQKEVFSLYCETLRNSLVPCLWGYSSLPHTVNSFWGLLRLICFSWVIGL